MAAVLFSRIISLLFTLLCPLDWLNMMWWSPRTAWFLKRSRFRKRMLRSPVRTPSLWYDMLTAEFIWMIYHYLSCRISDAHGRTIISLTGQDYQDLSLYKLIEFCPCKYYAGGQTSFVCRWSLWALNAICLLAYCVREMIWTTKNKNPWTYFLWSSRCQIFQLWFQIYACVCRPNIQICPHALPVSLCLGVCSASSLACSLDSYCSWWGPQHQEP